jgi:hypothetical protein
MIDESFIHLGHPLVLPAKNRSEAYNFILQKFKNKLTTYKANSMSHAARVELINPVFASIPVYYMSNIIFSKKVLPRSLLSFELSGGQVFPRNPLENLYALLHGKIFARQNRKKVLVFKIYRP